MKIAVMGTGAVGQTFAQRLIEVGHEVTMGTREVEDTLKRDKFKEWHSKNSAVKIANFDAACSFGEVIFNVLKGEATLPVFKGITSAALKDKVIIDISNPLDFSKGFPPSLMEGLNNTNSLGEELQKLVPQAKVVKTLNTMWNGLMVNPVLINKGHHINYVCGNDSGAKEKVKSLLNQFGWQQEHLLDLGDITNARGTESTLLIWTRIYAATNNGAFNFNLVTQ